MKKTDFPELEGKKVKFIHVDGTKYDCIVAGCCLDVGVTLVKSGEIDKNILCFSTKQNDVVSGSLGFDTAFYLTVYGIMAGTVDFKAINMLSGDTCGWGIQVQCNFR
jgi:hypothetical protein